MNYKQLQIPICIFVIILLTSLPPSLTAVSNCNVSMSAIGHSSLWQIELYSLQENDGNQVQIKLLRSNEWIKQVNAEVNDYIMLHIPDLNIKCKAFVVSIEPHHSIDFDKGSVVTGIFVSYNNDVLQIQFVEIDEIIELTAAHPLFSMDRKDWIKAGELSNGERIITQDGFATIKSISLLPERYVVYNLEISGDHSYYVTKKDILAHNTCTIEDLDTAFPKRIEGLKRYFTKHFHQFGHLVDIEDLVTLTYMRLRASVLKNGPNMADGIIGQAITKQADFMRRETWSNINKKLKKPQMFGLDIQNSKTGHFFENDIPTPDSVHQDTIVFDINSLFDSNILSTQEKQVLKLSFYEDMSYREISKKVGFSREKVRYVEQQALQKLRSQFGIE